MSTTISRRQFIALSAAGLATASSMSHAADEGKTFAYVGAWTQGPGFGKGGGGGISVFEFNRDGSLSFMSRTGPEFEDLNAGFLAISADGRFLYSTEEVSDLDDQDGAGGGVLSFSIDQSNGSLTHLNTQVSMGVNPSMLAIDDSGKILLVSNHGGLSVSTRVVLNDDGLPQVEKVFDDASLALLPINADGTLAPANDVAILDRVMGVPDEVWQRSAHAHSVVFDPTYERALVADKGTNRLYSYRLNKEKMTLEDAKHLTVAPGVAPRHSAFHPTAPFVFVSNEAEASLSSFRFNASSGELEFIQTAPTIPADASGVTRPSDIKLHPNGKFVYTGNRGHDSIAIHSVNQSTGRMEEVDIVSSVGIGPRGFTFDPTGSFLLVANQGSNQVNTFAVDPQTGKIESTGAEVAVLKPACIKFLQL